MVNMCVNVECNFFAFRERESESSLVYRKNCNIVLFSLCFSLVFLIYCQFLCIVYLVLSFVHQKLLRNFLVIISLYENIHPLFSLLHFSLLAVFSALFTYVFCFCQLLSIANCSLSRSNSYRSATVLFRILQISERFFVIRNCSVYISS